MTSTDVVIVGAGPYGLATAAHLSTIPGLEVRIFGQPMSFWADMMPEGMFLRSGWTATHIAHPHNALTLEEFQASTGDKFTRPVPLDEFVRYGRWYQKQGVPNLDTRGVVRVDSDSRGFVVDLADGETIVSKRVIVAAGIGSFAFRPPAFSALPQELVSHASEHKDFRNFKDKQILIVGGGQSALESAALIRESGGMAEVVARTKTIHWLQGWASTTLHWKLGKYVKNILYAPTDVGPAVLSQLCARPDLIRALPRLLQDRLRKRAVRPAGARWLVARLTCVPIHLGCSVLSVGVSGEKVKVQLSDGTERLVDHILLGTGYRVDIAKYNFLAPRLVESISRFNGYPRLRTGLETSVPNLHILGSPAAWSFGPVMQFVSGATYASRTVLKHVAAEKPQVQQVSVPA